MTMGRKKAETPVPTEVVVEAPADVVVPVVEVAPQCDHNLANDFWQDMETKKFMVRDRCLKCAYVGEPVWQMEAIMRPIPPPIFARF